jgi:hypothetical protein
VDGWRGGGLFNAGGTVILNHCTVRGNQANDGGGLANHDGTMLLTYTVVDRYRSTRDGGGIETAGGDAAGW